MVSQVYLTRRNLLTLLSKLDRVASGEQSTCTIIKKDNKHPTFPQTMPQLVITAIEDGEYYTDREAGDVLPADEPPTTKGH
jgi:hypothetical protein